MSLEKTALRVLERAEAGALTLRTPSGATHQFGGGGGPIADLHIRDWRIVPAVLAHGDVGLGEAYVAGWWDSSDVDAFVSWGARNASALYPKTSGTALSRRFFACLDALMRDNTRNGSRRNIHAHYDLGNEFYRLWLDEGMTYSSAIFEGAVDRLEDAQDRKYDRLLELTDGGRVLEIGCGWGGFAERAAAQGRDVTGVTISEAQHDYARARLGRRADIRLQDYRDTQGRYDSIVSIEMIEAVGERHWPTYFRTLKARLADSGKAALQAIVVPDASFDTYRTRSDYVRRHVFPGGMLLAPQRIADEAARAGLKVTDQFSFGQDYARTLRIWLQRFEAARPRIAALGMSDRFVRGWRFYLASCAALFAEKRTDVLQVALAHAEPA